MLKPVLLTALAVFALAIIVLVVVAARQPDEFRHVRSLKINAAPEAIYPHIADLRQWAQWSPYENRDPEMNRRYSGSETGEGATYAWEGKKIGVGSMTIAKATPARDVVLDMHFVKPFEAQHVAELKLTPDGDGTEVTWSMTGTHKLVFKVMGLLLNMDKMMANDFDTGLTNLKRISERAG